MYLRRVVNNMFLLKTFAGFTPVVTLPRAKSTQMLVPNSCRQQFDDQLDPESTSITSLLAAMFPEIPSTTPFPGYRPTKSSDQNLGLPSYVGTFDLSQLAGCLSTVDSNSHSLDSRRIRLEPRSHRLFPRQDKSFHSKTIPNGEVDSQGLRTATLDRVTYRGNHRKHPQTPEGKCHSNSLECRRYHTLGKTSSGYNGLENLPSNHSIIVDPLNKRFYGNYTGLMVDSFIYRTNGTKGRIPDRPKRPKSTERLFDVDYKLDCCQELSRDIYEKKDGKPRNGRQDKRSSECPREPLYEVIALTLDKPEERRRGRRPHSAPAMDEEKIKEEMPNPHGKRCQHRARKPLAPEFYQNETSKPLPKYGPAHTPATINVLAVENNNKIILNVDTADANGVSTTSDESSPGVQPTAAKRLRCASVPVAQNKIVVPRSAVSLPCMPLRDTKDSLGVDLATVDPISPGDSRPSSPATSTDSGNLTSECSGWVSSGDTSSSEQKRAGN